MKAVKKVLIPVFILAVGVAGLIVLGQKPEVPTKEADATDAAAEVIMATVAAWDDSFNIHVDGEAATYRIVTVGTEVAGRIVRKAEAARSGTFVKKGTLLFEMDSTNYQLEIDRLTAQLAQIDEELKAVDVDQENTARMIVLAEEDGALQKKHLNRMKTLQSRRTANESEVDAALRQELMARNSLQTLKNEQNTRSQAKNTKLAGRKLVETELARAKVDLDRCSVVSTLEGRIVDDLAEEGDYIKAGDPLVHISDNARMEIKTKLRGEELAWIWQQHAIPDPNSKASLHSADPLNLPKIRCEVGYEFEGVETIWDGRIARIEGTGIDRDTRTFPCRILVEEPQKTRIKDSVGNRRTVSPPTLLSGMFVSIRIPIESPLPLLRIPMEAMRPGGQIWVNRNGQLDIVEIRIANVQGQDALVRADGSGLKEGDQVIVSPLTSIRQGMKVKTPDSSAAVDPAVENVAEKPTQESVK